MGLLAAFVWPGLFYAGAAAAAAPIIIHLLARRRFKRVRWAAIDFLIDARRENRRRIRLEEVVLLALRCLAILLIALLISRPYLAPGQLAPAWSGARRTERVFVLDDSYSMGYESQGRTSFDRAKTAVGRLLDSIRREAPDDPVTLLRTLAMDLPVASGMYLDDVQTEELRARLEALQPSQRSIDAANVIEETARRLEGTPGIVNAAVYIISDFQRHDWVGREAAMTSDDAGGRLLDPLAAWAKEDHGLRVVFVNVGDEAAANTAVTALNLEAGRLVAGTTARLRAQVANQADDPVMNLAVDVTVSGMAQPSTPIRELAARHSLVVDLEVQFPREGYASLRAELPPDALPIDNVRYAAVEVANAIRVLVVNGEPSADEYQDEVFFLATALRPEGELFSGNEIVIVDEAELEGGSLASFHVVILANVYRVSEPAVESLEAFVRRGGGLLVFLGDQVDAEFYNAVLYRDGGGLLPAALGERIRARAESHLVVKDRLHPVMRGLSRDGDPLGTGQIAFFEYFGLIPFEAAPGPEPANAEVVGASPGRGRPARVLARFDDPGGHPAMVTRSFGRGTVIVVATAADKEWHHWPDHPTYLPVMMELVHAAAQRRDGAGETLVGTVLELPIDAGSFEPDVVIRTPAYPAEREGGILAQPAGDERGLKVRWEHTERAGLYQFVLAKREGGEVVQVVAVNVDPRESDLTIAGEDELRRAAGEVAFEYVEDIDQLADAIGEARVELWPVCLVMAVLVLMVEQGLAWRWGARN